MLLLKFYDGICQWEEGSSTPVLHITWAKHFVYSMTKFDCHARENLDIDVERDEDEKDVVEDEKKGEREEMKEEVKREEPWRDEKRMKRDGAVLSAIKIDVSNVENVEPKQRRGRGRPPKHKANIEKTNGVVSTDVTKSLDDDVNSVDSDSCARRQFSLADDNRKRDHDAVSDEENIKSAIEELASKVAVDGGEESQTESPNPNIAALAHACGESILNPEYLLGVGEPFSAASTTVNLFSTTTTPGTDTRVDFNEFLSSRSNGTSFPGMTMDSMLKADSPAGGMLLGVPRSDSSVWSTPTVVSETTSRQSSRPGSRLECRDDARLVLRSAKMKGLKDLLLAEKLNSSAIKLQLTAQSQVHLKHTKVAGDKLGSHDWGVSRKRTRRE